MDITEIKTQLAHDAESVARFLLPEGRRQGNEWRAGDTTGGEGKSLGVHLVGAKAGVWQDFAAGEGGDLLDLYCAVKGGSLSDALMWAKDWLGVIEPAFEPRRVKSYRKPQRSAECRTPKNGALQYLRGRGLSEQIIQALQIGELPAMEFEHKGGKVTSPAIVFPFKLAAKGDLVFVKYLAVERPDGDKLIRAEAGCEPILFGWQATPENAREVIICEGEINAASWLQYGHPALATPFGAGKGGKHNWIESEYERLARFETVYLDFDQDPPGRDAITDLVARLGRHRCRVVPAKPDGLKDINDCLQAGVAPAAITALLNASQSCDPTELRRASAFTEAVIDQFYPKDEAQLGIAPPFAQMAGRFNLRLGETTIWMGFSKHGKTQMLGQIHNHIAAQGERTCEASFEMRAPTLLKRKVRQITAQREPSVAYIRQVMAWMHDRIWLFDHVGSANPKRILEVFDYALQRYGVRYFAVDSLMKCGIAGDDYNGQDAFADALTNFANLNNVHVSLVAHTRKADDESRPPNGQDLKGSGGIKDRFHNVLIGWRNKPKEKARESFAQGLITESVMAKLAEPDALLIVDCQREGDGETPAVPLWFDLDSQQYRDREDAPIRPIVPFVQNAEWLEDLPEF